MYKFNIITLFPGFFTSPLSESLIGRGIEEQLLAVDLIDLRDHTADKHHKVDDYSYGGGEGMILMVEPIAEAIDAVHQKDPGRRVVMMTPQGARFDQRKAAEFAGLEGLTLLCGRYEGFDERARALVDEEISVGDYVLNGGESAAMIIIEAVSRLIPGVIGKETDFESHTTGLLEFPQYTRPRVWRGLGAPEVLLSGDHGRVRTWRYQASLARTYYRRPDLLNFEELSKTDREFLARLSAGLEPEFEFLRTDEGEPEAEAMEVKKGLA